MSRPGALQARIGAAGNSATVARAPAACDGDRLVVNRKATPRGEVLTCDLAIIELAVFSGSPRETD